MKNILKLNILERSGFYGKKRLNPGKLHPKICPFTGFWPTPGRLRPFVEFVGPVSIIEVSPYYPNRLNKKHDLAI
ncbi:MAG: hypothetical protein RIC19_01495 [Phaeodactylibacter sp.]|uniref:hypothetical protein n=1 Tax=Phaeodactylibacter sp. TaxID=1940289 RepID=UPI0032EACA37